MGSIADKLLKAFKENVGEWTCGYCNSGSNQPAATFREIKKMGYVFEEVAPNRWGRTMFCPVCNENRSHYKLVSTEPQVVEKPRCTITPTQRKRVLALFDERDAFSGAVSGGARLGCGLWHAVGRGALELLSRPRRL